MSPNMVRYFLLYCEVQCGVFSNLEIGGGQIKMKVIILNYTNLERKKVVVS